MLAGDNWVSSKGRALDAGKVEISDESAESIVAFFSQQGEFYQRWYRGEEFLCHGPCALDGSERWR